MRPTDDERREVARRLRGLDHSDLQESLICAYLDALGIEGYADWVGIAHRLADLIEPSCDREDLLELANRMEADVNEAIYFEMTMEPFGVAEYAAKIREAVGE